MSQKNGHLLVQLDPLQGATVLGALLSSSPKVQKVLEGLGEFGRE